MHPGIATLSVLVSCALSVLTAFACSTPDADPSIARDSAGVRIVESQRPVWSDASAWRVDSGAKVEVGGPVSSPDQLLSFVVGAQRFANGTIVVADGGSKELRFSGTNGALLHRIGGNGDGPGEFRDFGGVVASSDTLYVFDPTLQRISWFSKDGQLIGSRQLERTGSAVHPLRMYRLLATFEKTFVLVAQAFPADMKPTPLLHWDSLPTLPYSQEGTLSDTIAEFAGMDIYATPQEAGDIKFARVSSAAADGRLVYMTDGGRLSVRAYSTGGLTQVSSIERTPRPVTRNDIKGLFTAFLENARDDAARIRITAHLESWPRASAKPWISAIQIDDSGYLWAEEYMPWWQKQPRTWNVFDPEGRWLGSVQMPVNMRVTQSGHDFILGVVSDADGVESVQMFSLRR